jgi:hypothetical protein
VEHDIETLFRGDAIMLLKEAMYATDVSSTYSTCGKIRQVARDPSLGGPVRYGVSCHHLAPKAANTTKDP